MAVNIGLGERTYQKTEVFDTPGNHTWTHPLPGQNIEVFVEAFGGGGGGTNGSAAGDGGDTIWDTSSEAFVIAGGTGATDGSTPGAGSVHGVIGIGGAGAHATQQTIGYGTYGNGGHIISSYAGATGGSGYVKRFNRIVNGDINLTVGVGGASSDGMDGQNGAIIISYNITTTQTPVVVNMQRRDWEHFGELTWLTSPDTAGLSTPNADTWYTLTMNHERLDTGNKVTLDGSDLFTLQSGTYEFEVSGLNPYFYPSLPNLMNRLYNITDSKIEASELFMIVGSNNYDTGLKDLRWNGIIQLSSAKQFKLEVMLDDLSGVAYNTLGVGFNRFTDTTPNSQHRFKFQFKWRP